MSDPQWLAEMTPLLLGLLKRPFRPVLFSVRDVIEVGHLVCRPSLCNDITVGF